MCALYRFSFSASAVLPYFLLAVVGAVLAPAAAEASEPAISGGWIFDTDNVDEAAGHLGAFSAPRFAQWSVRGQASAERCVIDEDLFRCECVELSHGGTTIRARRLQRRDGKVDADGVRMSFAAERHREEYFVDTWQISEAPNAAYGLEKMVVWRADRRLETLSIASARHHSGARKPRQHAGGAVELAGLSWHTGPPRRLAAECGVSELEPTDEPVLTAQSASFDSGTWQVRGFDLVGLPPYLADYEAQSPGPVGGFLPPQILWSHATVDMRASYLLASWGVAPQLIVAPARWYGLGLGVADRHSAGSEDPPGFATPPSTVDVQLRWAHQSGEVRAAAVGDAAWGSPFRHASASAEAVGAAAFWETDRLARDGLFRPWRLSRLGVSLSGSNHSFGLRVAHPERIDPREYDVEQSRVGTAVDFATTHQLPGGLSGDVGVEHRSIVDADDGEHLTTLRVGGERVFGARGAVYARPALRGWMQTDLGSRGPGLSVGTTAQVVATADAGVALRGRFSGSSHRVEPAVVVAREVVGFSRSFDLSLAEQARLGREPSWTLAGLRLDQSFRLGRSFSADLPLALLYEGDGLDAALGRRPWGLAGLRVGHASGVTMGAHAACEQLCERVLWSAGARLERGAAAFSYASSRGAGAAGGPLLWRSSLRDGWSLIHAFQGEASGSDSEGVTHLGGVSLRRNRYGATGRARWAPRTDALGLSVGNTYAFPELGWSVGVEAAWRAQPTDWGVLVGLTHGG